MPALDADAFRRSLRKGELLPVYYFHGDEDVLKDDALRELLNAALDPSVRDFNLDRRRAADLSADELSTLLQTPPMLAARRAVVVTEVEDLAQRRPRAQAARAALLQYLQQPAGDTLLVLVQSAGEKLDADLSRVSAAVAFAPLSPERLLKWIHHRAEQDGLALEDDAARHLQHTVGSDLAQLTAEITKLRGAVSGRPATVDDVAELVGVRRGETAYDLVDAVAGRDVAAAIAMLPHVLEAPGASGVRLLIHLGTVMTGVALARALLDRGAGPGAVARELFDTLQAARPMGLRHWGEETRRWAEAAQRWTAAELDDALAALLRADRRLKSSSLGDDVKLVTDALLTMGVARAAA